jgi:hypothetical protein
MMWTRLLAAAMFLAGGTVCSRSADESATGLERCLQAARLADTVCIKQSDPAERLICLDKSRADQLACLDHAFPQAAPAQSGESASAPAAAAAENAAPAGPPSEDVAKQTEQPPPTEQPRAPDVPTGSIAAGESGSTLEKISKEASRPPPASSTAAIQPVERSEKSETPAANWIVSETTSPIDYSPLVTAVIHATPEANDGPNVLLVRCRRLQTEIAVRTDRAWTATRGHELQIEYQIDGQPGVKLPWVLSADGKMATYGADTVGFLQSLPDGATLRIDVSQKGGARHEAMFPLAGLQAIRKRIGVACNWASADTKAEKR